MFFKPYLLSVDGEAGRGSITDNPKPRFSWAAESSENDNRQTAYKITVKSGSRTKWDSGWVKSDNQFAFYEGESLLSGEELSWSITLKDKNGFESASAENIFLTALMEKWSPKWIMHKEDIIGKAVYFRKSFEVKGEIDMAYLYICGIGYQYVTVNGKKADMAYLQPAISNYRHNCYYITLNVKDLLNKGENCIGVVVGEGWRRNISEYLKYIKREVDFFGPPTLAAKLWIKYKDGEEAVTESDESWLVSHGGVVRSNLFDGEIFDEREEIKNWDRIEYRGNNFISAVQCTDFSPLLRAQTIAPIMEQETFSPKMKTYVDGGYIFDFGTNIAGIVRVRIPAEFKKGTVIKIQYAENILPDGTLDKETLRNAQNIDTYICDDNDEDRIWEVKFTYHGFRYIFVEGWQDIPDESDFKAVSLYTDIKNKSFFKCGSSLVNKIQDIIIRTEKNNIHSITTDCPQRDERMMWLNDATVRYEQMPYNFNMHRMFHKIICDIAAEQGSNGAIPCTAPFLFGNCPTDPVCSSFLIAAYQSLIHYGDKREIEQFYGAFKAWNECIKQLSENEIVRLSYYGDWAGVADCCESMEVARSIMVPGELISTAFHFYNYKLLEVFALKLNNKEEAEKNLKEAEKVRKAFLDKWWDEKCGKVWNGTQGCQALALKLDILPENGREAAAKVLHEAVVNVGYRIQTGNITTKYLFEMLSKYGYTDDAWKIITREEYPSFGYMLQNGATTIWERFELKRGSGMNSHDHPMYGAVGQWFYSFIAGLTPNEDGWKHFYVKPHLPKELTYAEARVDTPYGEIYIKWQKQMGQTDVLLHVPFGTSAYVTLPWGEVKEVSSGYHTFRKVGETYNV